MERRGGREDMAITEFKTHALRVLDAVADNKECVVVTKRGKPLAAIIPYTESKSTAGQLANTFVFEKDIVAPLGDMVIMSMKQYEETLAKPDVHAKLEAAEVHIEQGKMVAAEASVKMLRAKYRV